eukprot:gene11760-biopygen357
MRRRRRRFGETSTGMLRRRRRFEKTSTGMRRRGRSRSRSTRKCGVLGHVNKWASLRTHKHGTATKRLDANLGTRGGGATISCAQRVPPQ